MARITPLDIRKQEFKKSSFGFSREQVTHYLEQVADEVEELIRENNELRKEYGKLREKLSSYRNVEQSMNEALVLAKDSAKKTLVAAQKESEAVVQKAMTEKDALLFSAKEELSRLQRDIHTLRIKRDGILMKLKAVLKNHIEALELEFADPDDDDAEQPLIQSDPDEKIVDFSQGDVPLSEIEEELEEDQEAPDDDDDDLPDLDEPEINIESDEPNEEEEQKEK
jgi:cell division initiation protein